MAKQAPTIAVTGANGFLGSQLVSYFSEHGWRVVALVRHPQQYPKKNNITYVEYDLLKAPRPDVLRGVDYVVHAAYIKQDRKNPDAFAANIQGANYLLAAARAATTQKNIFISSMSSHESAISSYGRQKLAIEKLFNTSADVSLRLGLIIGNGGIVRTMTNFMRSKHLVPLPGGGKQPLQIINVHNVSKAIEQAIEHDANGTLTIANPRVYTYKEFYKALGNYLDIRVFFVPVSFPVLLGLLKLAGMLRLPIDIDIENVQGLQKLIAVDTRKDLRNLHIKLDDLDESLRQAALDKPEDAL